MGQLITTGASGDLPDPSWREVLAVPMGENDTGASTIGEYLVRLGAEVWWQRDNFHGRHPWGFAGWEYDVYRALARAGLVAMKIGAGGYLVDVPADQRARADAMIANSLAELAVLLREPLPEGSAKRAEATS